MNRYLLPVLGLLFLVAGAAHAQDDMMPGEMPPDALPQDQMMAAPPMDGEGVEDPCTQQVTETENALADVLQGGTLSEDTTNRVYELLDRADAECLDGDAAAAEATLAEARAAAQ